MSLALSLHTESNRLYARVRGRFVLASAQQSFAELVETALREHTDLVLLDASHVTGEPSMIDRFYYAKFAALSVALARQHHRRFNPRFAYVLKVPVLDKKRFGETVAVNRGMNVKVFEDIEAARAWLGITSSPRGLDLA